MQMDLIHLFLECESIEKEKSDEITDLFAVQNGVKFGVSLVVMIRFIRTILG